jgi:hypothetical protein
MKQKDLGSCPGIIAVVGDNTIAVRPKGNLFFETAFLCLSALPDL